MNKLKNTKKIYDQIEVPDNLSEIIQQTVNETSPPRSTRHFFKLLVPLTLAMTTVFVILLNTSPVLASNLSDIPLLTQIVKVLTFRNYQTMDEMKNIYVRIPVLENTGNNELEDRINYEIKKQIDFSVSKSEQLAKELYDTYIQAGYKPSQIEPFLVEVDYQTTFYNDRYLSFIIKKYENIPYSTVDKEQYYYNVDLQTGGHITLRTLFGPDYLTKVGTEIYKQIEAKKKEEQNKANSDSSSNNTNPNNNNSNSGPYLKTLTVEATAYSGHTITAMGTKPVRDPNGISTIAVDPNVIPLGSKVFIPGYGYAIAADTGGVILSLIHISEPTRP